MFKDYIKKSLPANLILFLLAILVGVSAFNMLRQALVLKKEARDTEAKIKELTRKKQELEAYLAELQTPEAQEREAKARLNLKRPGETVVVVVPDKKDTDVGGSPKNFWERVKDIFRKLLP